MPRFTYHTRLNIDTHQSDGLSVCATELSMIERKLFADIQRDSSQSYTELKKRYIVKYQITARQFNTLYHQLKGKIEAIKRSNERYSQLLKVKIKKLKQTIQRMIKRTDLVSTAKKRTLLGIIHQKKRRLTQLELKLEHLLTDIKNNTLRLCFGSKKLFRQQFNLTDHHFSNHDEWRKAWQQARQQQFSLSGSKDETAGNQSCVITRQDNGQYQLRVRLPNTCSEKYLILKNISFPYGRSTIDAAIDDNIRRWTLHKSANPDYKQAGVSMAYRFIQDNKGWRLFLTTDQKQPEIITNRCLGVIGVDLNEGHIAATETDHNGNPIDHWTIPLPLRHQSSTQREAIIGDAVKQLVTIAMERQKPIVKEQLDFDKKKAELQRGNAQYARMLSSFAYHLLHSFMLSRCFRFGVECFEVNPAYTSVIGRIKFSKHYGLSVHHAAALVIGRRLLGYSEHPPRQKSASVATGKGDHVTFWLPVRNVKKHEWSYWAVISKQLKGVLAAHFKVVKNQSLMASTGLNLTIPSDDELPF